MGFADFPVEIFKAMRSKPAESPKPGGTPKLLSRSSTPHTLPTDSKDEPKADGSTAPLPILPKLPALTDVSTEVDRTSTQGTQHENEVGKHDVQNGTLHRSNSAVSRSSQEEPLTPRLSSHRVSTDTSSHRVQRTLSGSQIGHIPFDAAVGAGRSLGRIVGAGLKSPMDFTLSLARGFHNAPKLYGDESVRRGDRITGIQSGLKAAGKVRRLNGLC